MWRWQFRIGLTLLACLHIVLAFALPYADDELYYWCWAEQLQASYFDHPPMTAYLIWVSQSIFGDNALGLRFSALISTWVVIIVLGWLTRYSFLIIGIIATPVYIFGAVLVTPDTPLLMFWALYLAWLIWMQKQAKPPGWGWVLGGAILGCGMLGKYTTALLVPAGALSFLFSGIHWRGWLVGYIGHGGVAAVLFTPVVWFNVEHDFAPIRFQWNHAMADGSNPLETFGSFLGTQFLLVGFMPFALLPWAIVHSRTLMREPATRVCYWLFVLPIVLFLYKSLKGPLEANWALAAYIGAWPLLAYWYSERTEAWQKVVAWIGFIIPIGTTIVLAWHLVNPLPFITPSHDRLSKEAAKQHLVDEFRRDYAEGEPLPVMTITYQWTARLRHAGLPAVQLAGATRDSNFTLDPRTMADYDRLYVFAEGPLLHQYVPGFGPPTILVTYQLRVRGEVVHEFKWMLYQRKSI